MCVCFCGCRQYMVAIPAVLEAGAETKFCMSLLQPNETLVMTVTLTSQEKNTTLFQKTSSKGFHTCTQFEVSSRDGLSVISTTFFENVLIKIQHSLSWRTLMGFHDTYS